MIKDDISAYYCIFGIGIRIWFKTSFWHWGWYWANSDEKLCIELGPITIYK